MIISILFKDKVTGEFRGRPYSYLTELPLKVGDIVIAPAGKGTSIGCVSEVNVPESNIDERVIPLLRTITEYAEEGAE